MSSARSATNSAPVEAAFDARGFLATLTESPGVYRMLAADRAVLYVGKAKNLKKRVASYFNKGGHSPRIALMLQQVAAMEVTATRSEAEALILENTLIKKLAPNFCMFLGARQDAGVVGDTPQRRSTTAMRRLRASRASGPS